MDVRNLFTTIRGHANVKVFQEHKVDFLEILGIVQWLEGGGVTKIML